MSENCSGRSLISLYKLRSFYFIPGHSCENLSTGHFCCFFPERLERGGPSWLLKLRWVGTQRVQMKGDHPWLVRCVCRARYKIFFFSLGGSLCLSCRYKRFSSALAALIGPVQNCFFLTVHFFNSFETIAQNAGQAAVLGRLSLSICLWFIPKPMPEFFPSANSINST